ncbi:MAG: hypothetical protein N3A66_12330, partial [Planctomycetota bacterium]|nr:hypothetical protein [Planctomycetota bacterium]
MLPARELFGGEHRVAPRGWGGAFSVPLHEGPKRREYTLEYALAENKTREAVANAILGLARDEPLRERICAAFAGLPFRRWFE